MGIKTPFDPLGTTGNQKGLPFTFTIDTTKNTENPSDNTFIVPLTAGTYSSLNTTNFGIIWGDGTTTIINDGIFTQENCTHTYSTAGQYTISLVSATDTSPQFNAYENYKNINNNNLKIINTQSSIIPPIDTNNNLLIDNTCKNIFRDCTNLITISATLFKNIPEARDNAFYFAFANTAITTIPNTLFRYNTEVRDSAFEGTFSNTNITSIPAALFRYNTKARNRAFCNTFDHCTNIASLPDNLFLYNTAVGLEGFNSVFQNCNNLVTITDNLFYTNTNCTGFYRAFYGCTKVTINPYIFGNYNITPSTKERFNNNIEYDFREMFYRDTFTGSTGSCGIPGDFWNWTYQQTPLSTNCYGGVGNTALENYKSIPEAWGGPAIYRVTVNATPSNATILLQATGYTQVNNYIDVHYGTQVRYSVSKSDYVTQSNTITVTEDTTLDITLTPILYTFTIEPDPATAIVTLTATGYTQQDNSISVPNNTTINWTVADTHYITQSGTKVLTANEVLPVSLTPKTYTFTIVPTPSDATVIINGIERSTVQLPYNTYVEWSVTKSGYGVERGQFNIDQDLTLPVTLSNAQYTFTIIPVPADATVIINGVERSSITATVNTMITYTVSKEGYFDTNDTFELLYNTTSTITLEKAYRVTINPTPADATVTLTSTGYEQVENYIEVSLNATVNWTVSKQNYTSQSGSLQVTQDTTLNIDLVAELARFTINPTPADATVTFAVPGYTQVNNYIDVPFNTPVTWQVYKANYFTENGTQTIADNTTLAVTLTSLTYVDVENYTYTTTTTTYYCWYEGDFADDKIYTLSASPAAGDPYYYYSSSANAYLLGGTLSSANPSQVIKESEYIPYDRWSGGDTTIATSDVIITAYSGSDTNIIAPHLIQEG